jgi:hypothetical protein
MPREDIYLPDQIKKIVALKAYGLDNGKIAERFGRTKASINSLLDKLSRCCSTPNNGANMAAKKKAVKKATKKPVAKKPAVKAKKKK